jgi:hypothetical protein
VPDQISSYHQYYRRSFFSIALLMSLLVVVILILEHRRRRWRNENKRERKSCRGEMRWVEKKGWTFTKISFIWSFEISKPSLCNICVQVCVL